MKELTREDRMVISQKLHEALGECWHDWSKTTEDHFPNRWCHKCHALEYAVGVGYQYPDYTSSSEPCNLLGAIEMHIGGLGERLTQLYYRIIYNIVQDGEECPPAPFDVVTASPEIRAQAAVEVLTGGYGQY